MTSPSPSNVNGSASSSSASSTPSTEMRLLPKPLVRRILTLDSTKTTQNASLPKKVKVTAWGTPLESAKHVLFYFGGMPSSAEEPALHSAISKKSSDIYADRNIHLICIDKPGMGESSYLYNFQIRRDWPVIVSQVAHQMGIVHKTTMTATTQQEQPHQKHERYGVMGMSNGGPHVMAALTHPDLAHRVKAAAMVVGVSDVWESGYFHWRSPSTLFEGLYNSLPQIVTGPLNALGLYAGSLYLFRFGGFSQIFPDLPDDAQEPLKAVLRDGAKNAGLGSALDCQQGLSPLFARQSSNQDERSVNRQASAAYGQIQVPVSLWYGTKDDSVPMRSAEWLNQQIPKSKLHKVEGGGHGLYFSGSNAEDILDDLVRLMDESDKVLYANDGNSYKAKVEESQ